MSLADRRLAGHQGPHLPRASGRRPRGRRRPPPAHRHRRARRARRSSPTCRTPTCPGSGCRSAGGGSAQGRCDRRGCGRPRWMPRAAASDREPSYRWTPDRAASTPAVAGAGQRDRPHWVRCADGRLLEQGSGWSPPRERASIVRSSAATAFPHCRPAQVGYRRPVPRRPPDAHAHRFSTAIRRAATSAFTILAPHSRTSVRRARTPVLSNRPLEPFLESDLGLVTEPPVVSSLVRPAHREARTGPGHPAGRAPRWAQPAVEPAEQAVLHRERGEADGLDAQAGRVEAQDVGVVGAVVGGASAPASAVSLAAGGVGEARILWIPAMNRLPDTGWRTPRRRRST